MKANVKVFILSFFLALPLGAQTRFENKVEEDFWLQSRNINGIRELPYYPERRGVSFAELHAGLDAGGYHDPSQSDRSFDAGARTGTLVHLAKTSMIGTFSFRERRGDGMCGSMFIDAGRYPFDVLEFTPGGKTLQTYSFSGGLTHVLSPSWSIGGKMNFESDNYAKRKDIRHTNYRLDLTCEPAVMYRHDDVRIGLSFLFRKQSESITAEQIGSATADTYYAFLDKGLFYGSYQVWNGSGVHLAETGLNRFPVTILSYGPAVQASLAEKLSLEASYTHARGEAGEKGFTWFTFPEDKVNLLAEFRWGGPLSQWIRLGYEGRSRTNHETVLDRVTTGGVTLPVIYGSNAIFREREDRLTLRYRGVTLEGSGLDIRLGGERRDERSFLMYPYAACSKEYLVDGALALWYRTGRWRLGLDADFRSGLRDKDTLEDLREGATTPETEPFRLTDWYQRCREYRLAPCLDGRLSVRFYFGKGLYAGAEGGFTKGFRLQYLEKSTLFSGGLRIGTEF